MNMVKTFETFEEGIKNLCDLVPEVKEYVGDSTDYNQVVINMMEKIKSNIPSVLNPEHPASFAFSIQANEVGFKTRTYSSFGWRTIVKNGVVSYSFRYTVTTRNKLAKPSAAILALKEAGWAEKENAVK